MEFFALLGLVALITIAIFLRKKRARRRFSQAVYHYDYQRSLRIEAGDDPLSIPTVEEFLAARGELHLLAQTEWSGSEFHTVSSRVVETDDIEIYEYDDDGYESFVAEMWQQKGVDLQGIVVERETLAGSIDCALYSFVGGRNGYGYLNLYEDGERKTYAADGRHQWKRFGRVIDSSAFVALERGVDADTALRFQGYARSPEEAVLPEFDKFQTTDKKYVLAYCSDEKGLSFRVVSKVIRLGDRFSARCHFRWGERRMFLSRNLLAVLDLQTGLPVDTEAFLAKRR